MPAAGCRRASSTRRASKTGVGLRGQPWSFFAIYTDPMSGYNRANNREFVPRKVPFNLEGTPTPHLGGYHEVEKVVQYFHTKLDIAPVEELEGNIKMITTANAYRVRMESIAESCLVNYKTTKDQKWLRLHLIIEETTELITAFMHGDKVEALDALADLMYVTAGTAAVYNLPLTEAFLEVHRSNMTKEKQASDPNADRVSDKGPNYEPPQLERLLMERGQL